MKLIILEGPDGSGKTTLARRLQAEHSFKIVHAGPPRHPLSEEATLRRYLLPVVAAHAAGKPVVFDRWHLGELAYGPVLRGGSTLTVRAWQLLERFYAAIDLQVVLCLPPFKTCLNNWINNRDNELLCKAEDCTRVYAAYVKIWRSEFAHSYVRYDYTRHRDGAMAQALATLSGYSLPLGFTGSPWPRFLFIGERANGRPDLPFMSTRASSGWLHDVLQDAGFAERELAFTNTRDRRGQERDLTVAITHQLGLGPLTIIALGEAAQEICHRQGVAAEPLVHPQHWKRFHSARRVEYVSQLKKIRRRSP